MVCRLYGPPFQPGTATAAPSRTSCDSTIPSKMPAFIDAMHPAVVTGELTPPGVERDIELRQAFFRQVHTFLERFGVCSQPRGYIDIAGCKGTLLKSLAPTGDDLAHLNRRYTAFEIGGDEDDWLGGIV